MAKLAAFPEPMNVHQYLAFNATRPDKEKWELINGELFLNASPVSLHQWIAGNIIRHLYAPLRNAGHSYVAMIGIGVQIAELSAVEPDVMIRPRTNAHKNICDDIVVAFEVLSPSTRLHDLDFKREAYPSLASLTHYVVVSAERMEVRVYARAAGWAEVVLVCPEELIQFESLRAHISLAEIYDDMTDLLEPATP
jgi:Uma2 family endonuclease